MAVFNTKHILLKRKCKATKLVSWKTVQCLGYSLSVCLYDATLKHLQHAVKYPQLNPLKPELNPICYLLELLGAYHFLHVSRIRVKLLTFRRLISYIYGAPIPDVSRSHTTTPHSRQDSSGRVISSSQRSLPDNTRRSQQTNIHAPVGFEPTISAGERPQAAPLLLFSSNLKFV